MITFQVSLSFMIFKAILEQKNTIDFMQLHPVIFSCKKNTSKCLQYYQLKWMFQLWSNLNGYKTLDVIK